MAAESLMFLMWLLAGPSYPNVPTPDAFCLDATRNSSTVLGCHVSLNPIPELNPPLPSVVYPNPKPGATCSSWKGFVLAIRMLGFTRDW